LSDSKLDDRQESGWVADEIAGPAGRTAALTCQLIEPCSPDGDERDFGSHEDRIQRNEDGYDQELAEGVAHHRPCRRPAAIDNGKRTGAPGVPGGSIS
jgi:hypothetical protein